MAKVDVKRKLQATKIMPDENDVTRDVHVEPRTSNRFQNYNRTQETFNDMGLTQNRLKKSRNERIGSNSETRKLDVNREESKFKHLFKLLIGQNILPDLNDFMGKRLTKGQKKKIHRWEEYFKKIQNMTYYGVMNNEGDRRLRYMEYDRMEWMTPEVGRALDVLAADATIKNEEGNVVKVSSENENLKEELEHLFFDILDLNSQSYWMVRDMCKYGDSFWTNHIDSDNGFRKILPAPVEQCEREAGYDEANPLAYRFRIAGLGTEYLLPYEVSHFRLRASTDFGEYGKSILENGRRIWRQLITIEDSMIIYRLIRAPERRIFYFDVGGLAPNEVENAVNRFSATLKKDRIYEEDGSIDYRAALQSVEEDLVIPTRGDKVSTKIESLPSQQWGAIDDVTYIHQKFISSLGVPNAYLNFEESLNSKATLGNEDIRYAKYVERLQDAFLATLYDIALVHLYLRGYKMLDIKEFRLDLTNPSHINELQEIEIVQARLDLFANAKEAGAYSTYWLYKNVLKLSDDEIEDEENNKIRDKIYEFCLTNAENGVVMFPKDVLDYNKAEQLAAAGAGGGDEGGFGGGGGFGGDIGGDMGGGEFGGFDEGGEEFGDEELSAAQDVGLELPNDIEGIGEEGGEEE